MIKKIILSNIFLLFLVNSSISFANTNVAIIDLDYILANSKAGKLFLQNIENLDKKNINDLSQKNEELKKLEIEIKNKKNIISKEAYNEEVKNFKIKANQFNNEKDLIVKKFNNFKNKSITDFFNKISPVINEYMNQNSIDILIDKKKIFMGNSNIDITMIVLEKINSLEE